MYSVVKFHIKENRYPRLFEYCTEMSAKSKRLRNAALFRIRQWYTAYGKDQVQRNQQDVIDEVLLTMKLSGREKPGIVIPYGFLERLMRITKNPDYFNGLPSQAAQWVLKNAVNDFFNWLAAMDAYDADPSKFTGKPKMPKYCKKDLHTFTITNQECKIKSRNDGTQFLHFPKTTETIDVTVPENGILKEVKVIPWHGDFLITVTLEYEKSVPERNAMFMAGIDLGVNNTAAIVINDGGKPVLYKGGALKAGNQFYNKNRAKYAGILMKGHKPGEVSLNTKKLAGISKNRSFFINDQLHKISSHIVNVCVKRNVGTIVIGKNTYWKTKSKMSKKSNQEFVQIPHSTLVWMIRYKAERKGITVIEQEESYTSKASFPDNDMIPIYDPENPEEHKFSGKRISRGLYRSKNGIVISADVNGGASILRKAYPEAFEGMDVSFLQEVETVGFYDLNPCRPKKKNCSVNKSIPVKRIAGV